MKKIIIALSVACVALTYASCSNPTTTTTESSEPAFVDSLSRAAAKVNGVMFAKNIETLPESDRTRFDKDEFLKGLTEIYLSDTTNMSYILGLQIGLNMIQQQRMMDMNDVPTNRNIFIEEFAKAFKLDSVPAEEFAKWQSELQSLQGKAQELMSAKQRKMQEEAMAKLEAENKVNMDAGKVYLDSVKAADKEVKTTESGLAYKVTQAGSGAKVVDGDRVVVKYVGKLIDGTVFDQNESAEFSTNGVVPGFGEGLKLMTKGQKTTLYIPGNLGYGVNGAGDKIAPGATLIFEVEVLDIKKGKK